ncbi:amidohydrolase family protein [Pseudactinotalea sp. Z1748]|uniref:metal-dependent hydrolase family protein n=1 Tax=Pseudactinotalea sp. Z1748 TaxID=3413027 RepID=UPI003C7A6605
MALILPGVTYWDGGSSGMRTADIVCSGGVISQLAAPGSTHAGADDEVLEVPDAVVLPGLVDGHVHLVWDSSQDPAAQVAADGEQVTAIRALTHAGAHLGAGVTTVADLGSNWDVSLAVDRAVREGHVRGPNVVATGRTVVMTGGHDPFWGNFCDGADAVVRGVREQIFAGARIIKTCATGGVYGRAVGEEVGASEYTRAELSALAGEAHRRGVRATAHALGTEGIRNAVLAGIDVIQHGVFLTEDVVAAMVERGTVLSPTLAVYRTIAGGSAPEYAVAKATEVVRAHRESVQMAIEAGVPVIAGTDSGSPGMPHPSLAAELSALLDVGLAPMEVLKAATSRAGDALGVDAGRVRVGSPADLIVVPGDPLTDPVAATRPRLVVLGGRVLGGAALDGPELGRAEAVRVLR